MNRHKATCWLMLVIAAMFSGGVLRSAHELIEHGPIALPSHDVGETAHSHGHHCCSHSHAAPASPHHRSHQELPDEHRDCPDDHQDCQTCQLLASLITDVPMVTAAPAVSLLRIAQIDKPRAAACRRHFSLPLARGPPRCV